MEKAIFYTEKAKFYMEKAKFYIEKHCCPVNRL